MTSPDLRRRAEEVWKQISGKLPYPTRLWYPFSIDLITDALTTVQREGAEQERIRLHSGDWVPPHVVLNKVKEEREAAARVADRMVMWHTKLDHEPSIVEASELIATAIRSRTANAGSRT